MRGGNLTENWGKKGKVGERKDLLPHAARGSLNIGKPYRKFWSESNQASSHHLGLGSCNAGGGGRWDILTLKKIAA